MNEATQLLDMKWVVIVTINGWIVNTDNEQLSLNQLLARVAPQLLEGGYSDHK